MKFIGKATKNILTILLLFCIIILSVFIFIDSFDNEPKYSLKIINTEHRPYIVEEIKYDNNTYLIFRIESTNNFAVTKK